MRREVMRQKEKLIHGLDAAVSEAKDVLVVFAGWSSRQENEETKPAPRTRAEIVWFWVSTVSRELQIPCANHAIAATHALSPFAHLILRHFGRATLAGQSTIPGLGPQNLCNPPRSVLQLPAQSRFQRACAGEVPDGLRRFRQPLDRAAQSRGPQGGPRTLGTLLPTAGRGSAQTASGPLAACSG
jgi:hypothetical protein